MVSHNKKTKTPLRQMRERSGWTQEQAADKLYELSRLEQRLGARGDINAQMISRWETGKHPPDLFWQRMLSTLYGVPLHELGFLEIHSEHPSSHRPFLQTGDAQLPSNTVHSFPLDGNEALVPLDEHDSHQAYSSYVATHPARHQAIDLLCDNALPLEKRLGAWLVLGASDVATLVDEGWSVGDILESLQVVLRGVQSMPKFNRRTLLQLGAAALMSGIPIPQGKHVSYDERIQFGRALSESIIAGWKLFHTAGNAQVLAVGQAQLFLAQQNLALLTLHDQPALYSAIYHLIGAALHFQGRYDEAYRAHNQAYATALEGTDIRGMAECRIWQADELKEQKRYIEASQTFEAALRLISPQRDTESIRTKAHILASSAENAALMGDVQEVESRLRASEELLEHLPGLCEEFDHASWHEIAGVCALHLEDYTGAISHLEQALEVLPPQWILRQTTGLMPLVMAYASLHEREASLATAEKALPFVKAMNAPNMTKQFVSYTTCALKNAFPDDVPMRHFIDEMQLQLLPQ